jgi:hypothetical protein
MILVCPKIITNPYIGYFIIYIYQLKTQPSSELQSHITSHTTKPRGLVQYFLFHFEDGSSDSKEGAANIRQRKTANGGKAVEDFRDDGSCIIQLFKLSMYSLSDPTLQMLRIQSKLTERTSHRQKQTPFRSKNTKTPQTRTTR